MRVCDMMTKDVVTIHLDDSLAVVKKIFDRTGFHHLLVQNDAKLVGVVSDRDLLKALAPNVDSALATTKDLACLNKRTHQVMTRKLVVLGPDADAFEAVEIFNQHKISCIPIVDEQYAPIGILSWRDIIKTLALRKSKEKKSGD